MMPIWALLTGAIVWGLIWYPLRMLEQGGIGGELAVTLIYACAFGLGAILFRGELLKARWSWPLAAIGLSAGWANVGFTLGVVYGDVMRVVLLFYLAPVWTVLLARLFLGEKLSGFGYGLILFAFAGALVILWQPETGWPFPRSPAEWSGLSAGAAFAVSNVLARSARTLPLPLKVLAVFAGGVLIGIVCLVFTRPALFEWTRSPGQIVQLLLLSVTILSVNIAVQYGLAQVSANRAIVIYLFELVVTAVSTGLLLGELLTIPEWCGGAMIVIAGLLSDRLASPPNPRPVT